MTFKRTLAIVGIGPRGSHALENFLSQLAQRGDYSQMHILLFEETNCPGFSPVYNIAQAKTNWINISERILTLPARKEMETDGVNIPFFPSYHEWTDKDFSILSKRQPDQYPPRAKIGKYLSERFNSILQPLEHANIATIINERVDNINIENETIILETNEQKVYKADEVLLTIGHQPTKDSEQISRWKEFSKTNDSIHLFPFPYPVKKIVASERINHKSTIGIRGFGLAMMDVVRAIAEKLGDFKFENEATREVKYQPHRFISNLFVPFSLDGLPMSPKPLNAEIDQLYEPNKEQISTFEKIIGDKNIQKKATTPSFLIDAIAPIAANIFMAFPQKVSDPTLSIEEVITVATAWLRDNNYQHYTLTPHEQSAEARTVRNFVNMALGTGAVSLDYCMGQVWRQCQPSIYDQLSYNECSDTTFAAIIHLDESMKRYSYGPPVESLQQLLALISAGIMNLEMVNNPEIEQMPEGWKFKLNGKTLTADIMIDSVLDSPQILSVDSPLIKNLMDNKLIQAVHDDYGVLTDENGYVISKNTHQLLPIALLGRLAKGTIIGVDAILECFGKRPEKWAVEAVNRHIKWSNKDIK